MTADPNPRATGLLLQALLDQSRERFTPLGQKLLELAVTTLVGDPPGEPIDEQTEVQRAFDTLNRVSAFLHGEPGASDELTAALDATTATVLRVCGFAEDWTFRPLASGAFEIVDRTRRQRWCFPVSAIGSDVLRDALDSMADVLERPA